MRKTALISLLLIVSLGLGIVFERTGNLSSRLANVYNKIFNGNSVVEDQIDFQSNNEKKEKSILY